jgi:uracil-DNA glycosylase family 4
MIGSVTNISEMNKALKERCESVGLEFNCGCGGLFNASIAFIAEAPGDREVEQRVPLVGGTGKVLWECLRKENISRNQVYVTNVVKRRLLSTSESYGKQKAIIGSGELAHWRAVLLEELSLLPNVRYIVALGNYALQSLTGQSGITQRRGDVIPITLDGRERFVITTYNPAAIMREPKLELTFKMDLHKITRVVLGAYKPPVINEIINPTYREALEYIDYCERIGHAISYDIEFMAQETACIGLAPSDDEGMCINFRDQKTNRYTIEEERDIRLRFQKLFANKEVRFIGQNANFDMYWMWFKDRIRVHGTWFDTMLAHHVLYPPLPHNLGYITSQYTDMPYYKDDIAEWREVGDIDMFWRYNVKDCVATRRAAFRMLTELREQQLEDFFFNHVMKLQPHLVRMTVGGIKCDTELKQGYVEDLAQDIEKRRRAFVEACRVATHDDAYECNPLSPRDLGKLFFEELRLVGRGVSTDAENRARLFKHPRTSEPAKEVIRILDEYKVEHKFFSTYASSTVDDDGRFRCEYKQTGVQSAPGRLSSAQTMWGTGLNLQNIPERGKGMFLIDDGYVASYFDASQIEARIVAYLANITKWKEQFERARLNPGSYDAHCALASDMFKVPYDQVPKSDFDANGKHTIRYVAKRCRHGLNYRMGADRLATASGLTLREADTAWHIYHRETPELVVWWTDTITEVRRTRVLMSPFGRRWILLERFDDDALESIVAFKPQSTAGDKVASVIYLSENDPRWPTDARIILNIHDALVAIHRPEDGAIVRSIMKEHMEKPIIIRGESLIIPSEFAVTVPDETGKHRWSTLKKIKEAA